MFKRNKSLFIPICSLQQQQKKSDETINGFALQPRNIKKNYSRKLRGNIIVEPPVCETVNEWNKLGK